MDDRTVVAKRQRNEAKRRRRLERARAVPEPPGRFSWFHLVTGAITLLAAAPLVVAAVQPGVVADWLVLPGGFAAFLLALVVPMSVLPTAPTEYVRARADRLVAHTSHGRREIALDRLERVRGRELLGRLSLLMTLYLRDTEGRRVLLVDDGYRFTSGIPREVVRAVEVLADEQPDRVSRPVRQAYGLGPPRRFAALRDDVELLLSPLLLVAAGLLPLAVWGVAFSALGGRLQ